MEFYRPTNIWSVHFHVTPDEWRALEPKRIRGMSDWMRPDGKMPLRNPVASRNGLAGVLGLDFAWSTARVDLGELTFTNVALRFKGNGTYIGEAYGFKRPYKVDLEKHVKGRQFAERKTFNFGNLSADASCLGDAMGYEFFRDAGVC